MVRRGRTTTTIGELRRIFLGGKQMGEERRDLRALRAFIDFLGHGSSPHDWPAKRRATPAIARGTAAVQ